MQKKNPRLTGKGKSSSNIPWVGDMLVFRGISVLKMTMPPEENRQDEVQLHIMPQASKDVLCGVTLVDSLKTRHLRKT